MQWIGIDPIQIHLIQNSPRIFFSCSVALINCNWTIKLCLFINVCQPHWANRKGLRLMQFFAASALHWLHYRACSANTNRHSSRPKEHSFIFALPLPHLRTNKWPRMWRPKKMFFFGKETPFHAEDEGGERARSLACKQIELAFCVAIFRCSLIQLFAASEWRKMEGFLVFLLIYYFLGYEKCSVGACEMILCISLVNGLKWAENANSEKYAFSLDHNT